LRRGDEGESRSGVAGAGVLALEAMIGRAHRGGLDVTDLTFSECGSTILSGRGPRDRRQPAALLDDSEIDRFNSRMLPQLARVDHRLIAAPGQA
jgi:hypothetical protein